MVTSRRGGSFWFFSNISNTKLRDNPAAVYRSIRRFTEHFASSGRALGVLVFEFGRFLNVFFDWLEIARIRDVQPAVDSSARRTLYVELSVCAPSYPTHF